MKEHIAPPVWVGDDEVTSRLGISRTTLGKLRASGALRAGEHWCWLGGSPGGKVGFDLARIEQWQRDRAQQFAGIDQESQ